MSPSPASRLLRVTTLVACIHALSIGPAFLTGLAAPQSSAPRIAAGDSQAAGEWSGPYRWPLAATHAVLLETGKVLLWSEDAEVATWDPATGALINAPHAPGHIAGAGHVTGTDGRPLIIGGSPGGSANVGAADANEFDPRILGWAPRPSMNRARIHPTGTVLADGRILITGGADTCDACDARTPEVYDPRTLLWTSLARAAAPRGDHPFMFTLTDGRVIAAGSARQATATAVLDISAGSWTTIDSRPIDGGSAVMYLPDRIMKSGTAAEDGTSVNAARTAYVLDMSDASPVWRQTTPMAYPRAFHNLTLLPDGSVAATGGATATGGADSSNSVLPAEIWSPATATWKTMSAMRQPRLQRSFALLLPDGRVLVGGGDATFEIFAPPYLFEGSRPRVTTVPSTLAHDSIGFVATPDAADIASVSLLRPGAVSHSFNQDQRFVPVAFQHAGGGLDITAPAANVAPPGPYLLFILNRRGVPSLGSFVTITSNEAPAAVASSFSTVDAVAVDASSPSLAIDATAWGDQPSSSSRTVTTSAFSTTAADELLLAFVGADDVAAGNTVTGISGAGLTWQLVQRTNAQRGTAEIWRAFAAAPLTNVTVTATLAQTASSSLTVMSFSGADPSGTNGSGAIGAVTSASASTGAPTATLTTTRNGSWVIGVGNDWSRATARTLGSGQAMVHQYLAPVGDTFWVQRTSTSIAASGTSVTINDVAPTGDRYNLSVCEILGAPAAGADTTPPAVAISAPAGGATVSGTAVAVSASASDEVGVAGVQFMIDGATLGVEDTASPYSTSWNTTAVADGAHTLTAVARDAAGNTTTSSPVTVTVNNSVGPVDLAVDGNQRFQVIDGFVVNTNSAAWNDGELRPALDMLLDQGASIFRVIIDKADWEAVNDNADPNVFDWSYYNAVYTSQKFENLWSTIGYLNQRGITTGLMLNFMGPGPDWMGSPRITPGNEDEWAEMIASLVYYARVVRNLQFTQLAPANEVDWDGIEGPQVDQWQYALLLRKLAQKLDAIGLGDIQFVGPDTASVSAGVNDYLPQLLADTTIMAKLRHFAFHNYADLSAGADSAIRNSAYPDRNFWMTEASFGSDYYGVERLIAQLKNGAAAAGVWDAYTSVYNHRANDGHPMLDLTGPNTWTPNNGFYAYEQLLKFARPGATRIAAAESASNLSAVAFYNIPSGQITVVGHNSGSERTLNVSLANLPVPGSLEYYETSLSRKFERRPDAPIVNGVASIDVDADAYFTLTTTPPPDATPPTVALVSPADGANVSGSITVSASASDSSGVGGVQFLLDGAPLGSEVTSPPYTLAWNTTTAPAGAHTLAARARDAVGNVGTSTPVTVTVTAPPPPSPLAIDATAWGDQPSSGSKTVTTSAFSTTAANELLLAFVGADDVAAGNTVTGITGAGLTWQLVLRTNAQRGTTEIWRTFASAPLTNVTVTATLAQTASSSLTVVSFTGAEPSGTNGSGAIGAVKSASAITGAPAATVTTTRSGSWVLGVGNDWSAATPRTLGSSQSMVHQYLAPVGDTFWVQRTSTSIAASGTSVTINDVAPTGDRYNLSVCEILAAGGDTTPPAVAVTTPTDGATVSGTVVAVSADATDNSGVAGVQFLLDGAALGSEVTSPPYTITWDTTITSAGTHALAARARDTVGNVSTSTPVTVTVTAPPPPVPLAIDAMASGDQPSSSSKTVTTSAFSTTAADELLLAFVAADDVAAGNTVTGITGAGLTWQLVLRTNVQRGTAEIWRAFASAPLTDVTVTATLAQTASSSLTVMSFSGVDPSGTNGSGAIGAVKSASASTGAPTATVTTTRDGSWVIGVGNDWSTATPRTLGSNQSMVHQYLAPVGDTFWVQRTSSSIAASGTIVTINDVAPTGDRYNLSVCEILPRP